MFSFVEYVLEYMCKQPILGIIWIRTNIYEQEKQKWERERGGLGLDACALLASLIFEDDV